MAYNTRKMLEDSNGDLIPQYFNQQSDVYEHLQGSQGVNFVGNHVLTDSGIWVPQRGTEDGAAHTQLTGSRVEEVLVERGIHNEGFSLIVAPPNWARGAIIYTRIYSSTGNFASNEGLSVEVRTAIGSGNDVVDSLESVTSTGQPSRIALHLYPGANDSNPTLNWVSKSALNTMVPNRLDIRFNISGTFSNDEGFDAFAKIMYLGGQ